MGRHAKDLTGKVFDELTVVEKCGNNGAHAAWLCRCSCGKEIVVSSHNLVRKCTTSCGHDKLEKGKIQKGEQYGGLTLVDKFRNSNGEIMCICKCFCGNEITLPIKKVYYYPSSCGCLRINKNIYKEHEDFFECLMSCGLSFKIDKEDYEKVSEHRWGLDGKYVTRNSDGKRLHRFILDDPIDVIDHINRDTFDNRKSNLRICKPRQNNMNRGPQKNNSIGYKGVSYNKKTKKYYAQLQNNGDRYFVWNLRTPEEAAIEYDKLALKYFGEFAYTNFPRENYEKEVEKQ